MQILKPNFFSEAGVYDLPRHTVTLAQQFINSTTKRWVEGRPMQLRMEVSPNDKLMLWAHMLLVNPEESACQKDPALVAAFLTYWNVDGYTLITSQGEMGYPLHTMYDAMGILISGRLYEEFIPLPSTVHGHV